MNFRTVLLQWRTSSQTYGSNLKFNEMFLSHRHCFGKCLVFLRNAHTQAGAECNYYKTLGVSPSASQAEIKAAYYDLSKKHHPDRNHGSEESARKFRLVRAAYEVLGNEKRRMQYDKERIFRAGRASDGSSQTDSGPDYKDDAERRHYQSRTRTSFGKYAYGKSSFYNFEAWFEGHYGKHFEIKFGKPRHFETSYHHKGTEKDLKFHSKIHTIATIIVYAMFVFCSLIVHRGNKKE